MSGNAISGCGVIYIDEIKPTLTKLSDDLEFHFDLNDYVLGSTGKKEYSGDIDLVIAKNWYDGSPKQFADDLCLLFGKNNVRKSGSLVHLKYSIQNFDICKNGRQPRTGYVQIDFNFGDSDLLKLFYHSPGNESKFKGLHRNIALSSVAGIVERIIFEGKDDQDRPIEQIRWKWGPNGLSKVKRISKKNDITDRWNKLQTDIDLGETITDANIIAKKLLNGKSEDMNSLESIIAAVKNHYNEYFQKEIFQKIAHNFQEKDAAKDYEYPSEIAKYFLTDDK